MGPLIGTTRRWCGRLLLWGALLWASLAGAVDVGAVDVTPARLPVVLVPGFLGFDVMPAFGSYLPSTVAALRARGDQVFIVKAPAIASSEDRAQAVVDTIARALSATGAQKVIVIGYSQGGLDVRAALDDDAVARKVGAVVTLSAPHGGTPTATMIERWPRLPVAVVLHALQGIWNEASFVPSTQRRAADVAGAFSSLSETTSASFNARHPRPPVPFFSVAGVTDQGTASVAACADSVWGTSLDVDTPARQLDLARVAHRLTGHTDATDGTTPTRQARFGHFLGCLPIDHADWMGPVLPGAVLDHDRVVLALVDGLALAAAAADDASAQAAMVARVRGLPAEARLARDLQ